MALLNVTMFCDPCTFAYASGHARQQLDLYSPTAGGVAAGHEGNLSFPTLIWIHGGGWREGSKADLPASILAMRSRGYAVASVGYRLTNVVQFPAQIEDAAAGVAWSTGACLENNSVILS